MELWAGLVADTSAGQRVPRRRADEERSRVQDDFLAGRIDVMVRHECRSAWV